MHHVRRGRLEPLALDAARDADDRIARLKAPRPIARPNAPRQIAGPRVRRNIDIGYVNGDEELTVVNTALATDDRAGSG